MKTTADYLDAVAARLGGASDYRVAMTLGVTPAAVCNWRKGRDSIGDDAALKVAELIGVEAAEIMIVAKAERAKNAAVKEAWESAYRALRGIAASLALAVVALFATSPPASAATGQSSARNMPMVGIM